MRSRKLFLSLFFLIVSLAAAGSLIAQQESPLWWGETSSFSPNGDGVSDLWIIRTEWKHPPSLDRWIVRILDSSGRHVRTLQSDRRWRRPRRSIRNLFFPDSLSIEPIRLFRKLRWDGLDSEGRRVPDGEYRVEGEYTPAGGIVRTLPPLTVRVDTKAPFLELSAARNLVRIPEPDETLPALLTTVQLRQRGDGDNGVRYRGEVIDESGRVVLERVWEGFLPETFLWDGRDGRGRGVSEGVYRYRLEAVDPGGNVTVREYPDLLVSLRQPMVDLTAGYYSFSPDCNGDRDRMVFHLSPLQEELKRSSSWESVLGVESWRFEIGDRSGGKVYYSLQKTAALPDSLEWDGKDESGRRMGEGIYYARIIMKTRYGIQETYPRPLRLDLSAPKIGLSFSSSKFTPEGDRSKGFLYLKPRGRDVSGIRHWKITLSLEPDAEENNTLLLHTFKVYEGSGELPERILWNGTGPGGEMLYSLERLSVEMEAEDEAGNRIRSAMGELETRVFARTNPGERELVFRLPDRSYFDDTGEVSSGGRKALRKIAGRLSRYGRYMVQVEVHTGLKGREETNLKLSERKVRNVYETLLDLGVSPDRLTFRGMGESEPLEEGESPFAEYRNNRIQLRLTPEPGARRR